MEAGTGLSSLGQHDADTTSNLRNISLPNSTFSDPIWMVTHVDLHRTSKEQSFTKILKKHTDQLPYQGQQPRTNPLTAFLKWCLSSPIGGVFSRVWRHNWLSTPPSHK